ncbi:hypothetical protein GKE82_23990 [Conexibacter sp. W3-3-2]|uniref:type IV pilus modification PilV family protein n=1 Tax=Conexibacter sp. W3-3-2 TaxID=2675227 RepID=UPI0012B6D7A1|nr:hypothetical protein [Conexibacter sp. W3-3-2]MTD47269.1 hypothetical protein [Conexibacter sp. W3-3-2]
MLSLRSEGGYSTLEVLTSMLVIVVAATTLASLLSDAGRVNVQTTNRGKAVQYAQQQLDRMRSLPFEDIGLAASDAGSDDSDWLAQCPVTPCTTAAANPGPSDTGRIVRLSTGRKASAATAAETDPRRTKRPLDTTSLSDGGFNEVPTAAASDATAYSYVYWNDARDRRYKLITVIVRYDDAPTGDVGTSADRLSNTVRLTAAVPDTPGLTQIPTS